MYIFGVVFAWVQFVGKVPGWKILFVWVFRCLSEITWGIWDKNPDVFGSDGPLCVRVPFLRSGCVGRGGGGKGSLSWGWFWVVFGMLVCF